MIAINANVTEHHPSHAKHFNTIPLHTHTHTHKLLQYHRGSEIAERVKERERETAS